MTDTNYCIVTKFEGNDQILHITIAMVREALNLLHEESIYFFKLTHIQEDRNQCIDKEKLVWDNLKHQSICLALQIRMQYFYMTYTHIWFTSKKTFARVCSLQDIQGEGVKYDYAQSLLYEIVIV